MQERLEREYNLNIITTVPNVEYKVFKTDGEIILVDNPAYMPEQGNIDHIEEPYISSQIITPIDFIGNIMKLAQDRRYWNSYIYYDIDDFYDKLKSISKGYASFDYDLIDYRASELVKLDIMLNGDPVDALSTIIHKENAYYWGRKLCEKLRKLIPRQMFEVAIQAAIGSKIISKLTLV